MSINAVNGFNNFQYGVKQQQDQITPETRQKLRELNIDENSVRTEAQAQKKINEKEEQFRKAIREQVQAQASSQQQVSQAGTQVQQPQQVQGVDKTEKVDGVKDSQQVKQPQGIEQQHAVHNQQQGDEQTKAAASQQIIQALPFEKGSELVAMYNKFKLGLV